MVSLKKCSWLCAIMVLVPVTAFGSVVDFESVMVPEGDAVTTVPGVAEMSIFGAMLVVPGSPILAFNGASQGGPGGPDNANSGNSIATPVGASGTTIAVTFTKPVSGLTFQLLDVEVGSVVEIITARVYDDAVGGNLLKTIVTTGGDPLTGDGVVTVVDFSGGFPGASSIRRLEIVGTFSTQSSISGWGVDGICYTVSSVPTEERTWGGVKALYDAQE